MKTKMNSKIDLKKYTISRISADKMLKVRAGDCLPTEHYEDRNSHVRCQSGQNPY